MRFAWSKRNTLTDQIPNGLRYRAFLAIHRLIEDRQNGSTGSSKPTRYLEDWSEE